LYLTSVIVRCPFVVSVLLSYICMKAFVIKDMYSGKHKDVSN
jgi:hypothetical protein